MFACGTGTTGYGTVLPTLYEACKDGLIEDICVAGKDGRKRTGVTQKVNMLNHLMGMNVSIAYFPDADCCNPSAYLDALERYRFDCAIIAVPDHLHFEVTQAAIQHHLHCLVVKPFVPTLKEAQRLLQLQQEQHIYGAVEFHKRFDEVNLRVRKMIRDRVIGDVLYSVVEYSQRKTIPLEQFRAWVEDTNIFQYLGVHYVDMIYFCSGAFPQRVMAVGQKRFLQQQGVNTYDAIQAVIEWRMPDTDHTFVSVINTNWIDSYHSSAMSDQKIMYVGTTGRIESDQKHRGLHVVTDDAGVEDINPYFSDFRYDIGGAVMNFRGYGQQSVMRFLKDCYALVNEQCFVKDLIGLRATFQDALISTAVVESVNVSLSHHNTWVSIPPADLAYRRQT